MAIPKPVFPLHRLIGALFLCIACLATPFATPLNAQSPEAHFFDSPPVNTGLGPRPEVIDLRTPRSAMASFIAATQSGDYESAAHVLDLGDLPPEVQRREGADLARRLSVVIDRQAILDWSLLRNRADGLNAIGPDQDPMVGEPRRSLLLRELDLTPAPAALRLNRIRSGGEGGDLVWVFSRETVADIDALYDRYGPSEWEALLPPALTQDAFGGLMWWELIGLPLLLLTAAATGFLTARIFRPIRKRAGRLGERIVAAAQTPAIIAAVTTILSWGTTQVLVFSSVLSTFISPLVAIGYTTAALMLVMNVLGAILERLMGPDAADLTHREVAEQRRAATRVAALRHMLTVVVFLVGAGIVMSQAEIFRGLGLSLLASAGAVTLVIGFAARQVLGNILASLQIALNQSARVGDRIMWHDKLCYVEQINFTYVLLRNWDDTRVVVPVSEFVSETFTNWTLEDPAILRILKFKLSPDADLDALRKAFHEILEDMKAGDHGSEMGDIDEAEMVVAGQDALGIDVWFGVPCLDPSTQWGVSCTARERIVQAARDIAERSERPVFPDGAVMEAAA
ncbi:mechanosensitive ion channel family protein [Hasllibacter sp. MH4015]|uniref:mechanosensitive ion channel family protein n=1 Tax=Hasllibacter sp. MH4015 TaxID=2854029 RepID=UPI001CD2D5C4|nr:mechanosensitive ion channel family protein [Hasllibacter sp. MH4015]